MIDIVHIKPSRMGTWLCFGFYLVAFALPARLDEVYVPGVSVFLLGALGFALSVCNVGFVLFHGVSRDMMYFLAATVPWLSNVIFWLALALYAQGHGRASLRAGLIAVVLAAGALLSNNPLSGSDYCGPRTEPILSQLSSPAYLAWAGSMGLLVLFAGYMAWRQNRVAALWPPTTEWLAENEYATFGTMSTRPTTQAFVAYRPTEGERRDSAQ